MNRYWKQFASLIDERTTRERVLILVTASVVVFMLMQSLLLGPALAERRRLVQEARNDQAEAGKMSEQVQALVRDKAADPDAALRTKLAELGARQAQLQRQFNAQSAELVPPEKMPAVLEKILANNPRLQLIEVKTLPRIAISIEKEVTPGREPKAAAADEKNPNEIYRHGVEVTMRGSYLDLLAYLMQIESLPVRMFWDRLSLSATAYPTVTMRLVVYTISLEKVWLKV